MGKIVDIGSGPHPEKTADVVVDLYEDGDTSSRGNPELKILQHQTFVNADIQDLPFEDKEFEYAYAKHILEHVDHPDKACAELMRIAKAGYIECPRSTWEHLFGRPYHLWLVDTDYTNNRLIFTRKTENNYKKNDFDGDRLFAEDKIFHDMFVENIDVFYVRLHWKDEFKYNVVV